MKLTVLMENTAVRPDLRFEHGLSLYVETARHRILFDTGQTAAFAENAEKLGVDLSQVDLAVLSHGHYDHGGGLMKFLELNDHAPVYLQKDAFMAHFNGPRYIGLDPRLEGNPRLRPVEGELVLDEELTLLDCNGREKLHPVESFGLTVREENGLAPDDFRHEQYLLIREGGKRVLLSGCSHKGILNIARWFRPDVLVGGFHFMKLDPQVPADREKLEQAARELLEYPTRYYTGHCTGLPQYEVLKGVMGDRLSYAGAGTVTLL